MAFDKAYLIPSVALFFVYFSFVFLVIIIVGSSRIPLHGLAMVDFLKNKSTSIIIIMHADFECNDTLGLKQVGKTIRKLPSCTTNIFILQKPSAYSTAAILLHEVQ